MGFRGEWLESVQRKGSVLCAGIDPAEFEIGRGENGLLEGTNKLEWSLRYVEAVAPYCAAVKLNIQYWKGDYDSEDLRELVSFARDLGVVVIDDSKLADIGSTNDAGMFYSKDMGADAVTLAPFAGNMEEASKKTHERGIEAITMCLMSNPEYEEEKNSLVRVDAITTYDSEDIIPVRIMGRKNDSPFVRRYIQLAHDANRFGLDGVVIGAPSESNHITEEELAKARRYVGESMLVLAPGWGTRWRSRVTF
tara:strand:- start:746 stop:1498 length:753 start_codon:yes stop_codon:yes gene_type:complete